MPRSGWACEPQLLSLHVWSLCSATREAAMVRGPRTAMKSGPHLPQLEKALPQKRRPNTAKNKLINKKKKKRGGQKEITPQQRGGHVTTEAEIGEMHPQAKEQAPTPEAGRGKK